MFCTVVRISTPGRPDNRTITSGQYEYYLTFDKRPLSVLFWHPARKYNVICITFEPPPPPPPRITFEDMLNTCVVYTPFPSTIEKNVRCAPQKCSNSRFSCAYDKNALTNVLLAHMTKCSKLTFFLPIWQKCSN